MTCLSKFTQVLHSRKWLAAGALAALVGSTAIGQYRSGAIPGRGIRETRVGDDFEDPEWAFTLNLPKASANIDHEVRLPAGISKNQRMYESTYRGTPDVVKRVDTPEGGIAGSKGALLLRTSIAGIPGQPSYKFQQDDLLMNVTQILGAPVPVSRSPSVVVRVYVPPFDKWEKRTGSSFGFRAELEGGSMQPDTSHKRFLRLNRMVKKYEPYWPGFFFQYNRKGDGQNKEDSATILVRSGSRGEDLFGPTIKEPGWWTLGMTFTPDGSVHYYASPGVDALTEKDHLFTTKPYGHTADKLNTFFFNVVVQDDARTWSTGWIIDDPELYYGSR